MLQQRRGCLLVEVSGPSFLPFAEIIPTTQIEGPIFHCFYDYYFNIIFLQYIWDIMANAMGHWVRLTHEYVFVCFENVTLFSGSVALVECGVLSVLGITQSRTRRGPSPWSPNFPTLNTYSTHSIKDMGHTEMLVLYLVLVSVLIP